MGLIGSVQAFTDPVFTMAGVAPTVDEGDGAGAFSSVFSDVVGGQQTASMTAATGEGAITLPGLFPEVPDSEDGEDSEGAVATMAAVVPVAVGADVPLEGSAEAASEPATATIEVPENLAALLEEAASEADLAELPGDIDGIDVSMLFNGEDVNEAAADAAESAAGDEVAEASAEVEFTVTVADEAVDGESEAAQETSTDVPAKEPVARTLDATEAPPDAPPDIEPAIDETSVVRSVGNAQEATEDAGTAADPPELPTAATEAAATDDPGVPETMSRAGLEAAGRASTEPAAAGADAPTPTEEPIRMESRPLDQVADAVVERLDGEGGEARIILDPPELGEIVIKLHARGDQVSLEVVAQRPEAIQMLRDGSPSLQLLLQERGLDLSTAQFSLSQQGQQSSGGEQGEHGQGNTVTGFAQLLGFDEPDDAASRNHNKLRAAYNPDGAFAYRV